MRRMHLLNDSVYFELKLYKPHCSCTMAKFIVKTIGLPDNIYKGKIQALSNIYTEITLQLITKVKWRRNWLLW